jgi:hypothetical protein
MRLRKGRRGLFNAFEIGVCVAGELGFGEED